MQTEDRRFRKKDAVKCKDTVGKTGNPCPVNASIEGYCKKHFDKKQRDKAIEDAGIQECRFNGCYNDVSNTGYTACEKCRVKARAKDKGRRTMKIENAKKELKEGEKLCKGCFKPFPLDKFSEFQGKITEKCIDCLEKQRFVEARRPKRNRDWTQELENNPERKEKRQRWRELPETKEMMKEACKRHREKKREEYGEEDYLAMNALAQKNWRENNPEKYEEIRDRSKRSPVVKLGYYKYRANKKNIEWGIDDEYAKAHFVCNCYYCGDPPSFENLNGIDRVDNSMGYIEGNIVPCCTTCNMRKGKMSEDEFINRCRKIVNRRIEEN